MGRKLFLVKKLPRTQLCHSPQGQIPQHQLCHSLHHHWEPCDEARIVPPLYPNGLYLSRAPTIALLLSPYASWRTCNHSES